MLVPNDAGKRNYGGNPYVRYDEIGTLPFLFRGELPEGRLRTDNWGGYGLTAETQEPYGECVNNVLIYGWTDRSGSKFERAW